MNLFRAELARFGARRLTRLMLLLAFVLVIVINVVQVVRGSTGIDVHGSGGGLTPPADCRIGTRDGQDIFDERCAFGNDGGIRQAPVPQTDAGGNFLPTKEFLIGRHSDTRPHVGRTLVDTIGGAGIALVLLGLVLGASYLAADFGTSLGAQLTFEPRRVRMYVTKCLAGAAGVAVVSIAILLWAAAMQFAASAVNGVISGVDGAWIAGRLGDVARVALVTGCAVPVAMFIALVTKRTAGAVGALFGFMIGSQFLLAASWGRPVARLLPIFAEWMAARNRFPHEADFPIRTLAGAMTITIVWAVLATAGGAWWFRRVEIR